MSSRILKISYTGMREDGKVFDTTDEKTAKDNNIFQEQKKYKPITVVTGAKQLLPGLEDLVKDLKEGEENEGLIPPEKAFGERDPEKIIVTPLNEFTKSKIHPFPGLIVDADGKQARVQSVSGGRVRLDFNHELAGKKVKYKVRVEKELKDTLKKCQALFERTYAYINEKDYPKLDLSKDELKVNYPEAIKKDNNFIKMLNKHYEEQVLQHVPEVKKITFNYTEPKKDSKEKTEQKPEAPKTEKKEEK